jgi:hypothetical protein
VAGSGPAAGRDPRGHLPLLLRGTVEPWADLVLSPEFEWDYRELRATADESGAFTVRGLRPGPYTMRRHVRTYGADAMTFLMKTDRIEVSPDGTLEYVGK